jgi:hypothetical protein
MTIVGQFEKHGFCGKWRNWWIWIDELEWIVYIARSEFGNDLIITFRLISLLLGSCKRSPSVVLEIWSMPHLPPFILTTEWLLTLCDLFISGTFGKALEYSIRHDQIDFGSSKNIVQNWNQSSRGFKMVWFDRWSRIFEHSKSTLIDLNPCNNRQGRCRKWFLWHSGWCILVEEHSSLCCFARCLSESMDGKWYVRCDMWCCALIGNERFQDFLLLAIWRLRRCESSGTFGYSSFPAFLIIKVPNRSLCLAFRFGDQRSIHFHKW